MILAAGLLLLVGVGLFVGGLGTGIPALYWACVGVCVIAALLLAVTRRRLSPAPSRSGTAAAGTDSDQPTRMDRLPAVGPARPAPSTVAGPGRAPAPEVPPGTDGPFRPADATGNGHAGRGTFAGSTSPASAPHGATAAPAPPAGAAPWEPAAPGPLPPPASGSPATEPPTTVPPTTVPPTTVPPTTVPPTTVPPTTEPPTTVPPATVPPAAAPAGTRPAGDRRSGQEAGEPPMEDVEVTDLLLVIDLRDEVLVIDEHPRYHLSGCPHLAGRPTVPLPLEEAKSGGFTPCGICTPDRVLAERVRARKAGRGS